MRINAMMDQAEHPAPPAREAESDSFRARVCLPFLRESQNGDGGWGYRPKGRSAVEATAWALAALGGGAIVRPADDRARRGTEWLMKMQLPDGSWPAFGGDGEGCWVTSLACLALFGCQPAKLAVAKGLHWLVNTLPRKPGPIARLRWKLFPSQRLARQDDSLLGWSWTPSTSSWVEPTAYALILLRNIPAKAAPRLAANRQRAAVAMLFDRMCPGGGWNSGNPSVYGVPGEPIIGPTAWALLALLEQAGNHEIEMSLGWLERAAARTEGAGSLALAHICLEAYGRPTPPIQSSLENFYQRNQFLEHVPVMAFTAMALDPAHGWRSRLSGGAGGR